MISRKLQSLLCLALLLAAQPACIRTRAIVQSDPPGAKVTMNDKVYGYTKENEPLEIMLNWYWFYDFELEQEGCEDFNQQVRVKAPPYAWLPLDLFFELLPVMILQEKQYTFTMSPAPAESGPEAILAP